MVCPERGDSDRPDAPFADPEGGDDGPGMDSPDDTSEDSYNDCPDAEQAFERFYHEVDNWAQCLANWTQTMRTLALRLQKDWRTSLTACATPQDVRKRVR